MIVTYKDKSIAYTIERKKVKNINLRITKEGKVTVSASKSISEKIINDFVTSKSEWIYGKLLQVEKLKNKRERIKASSLKFAYYLGKKYLIEYKETGENSGLKKDILNISISKLSKKDALKAWYIDRANHIFSEIIDKQFLKIYPDGEMSPKISIKPMKSRWGSCNKRLNKINLNLKLIHQPLDCIEYVITHELIHLTHANHSEQFYRKLEEVMPDYKSRKKMLDPLLIYI